MTVKVVVNGVGTIGKRVAHAVKLQNDMKLIGISDVAATSWLRTVLEPEGPLFKTDLYASNKEGMQKMRDAGMYVHGLLEDLLASGQVDVVVDCTPAGIGAKNKPLYEKQGVKVVYQGGEKADVAPISFVTIANYEKALNAQAVRVVSCNTTSLVRTLHALDARFGIEEVFAVLVRRATDPWDEMSGPINAVVPETHIPSHQGPDLQTVMPHINIKTMACKVPSTLAHTHFITGKLRRKATSEEIKRAFEDAGRIILLKAANGYSATSRIIERYRDLCRPRYDMYEVAVWEESVTAEGNRFYWIHAVHSEGIVIPENIDAIRAVTGIETDKFKCIEKTNKSLGIK
ncbi:MAG: type II glyceraldehyde-3-phosphate dehydrogenase [Candidatus Aenigmarchaeota archaeon]|nr:type II glyceraldehyde-3-phosphate dehydrogenase [Candidatus Aenigmarchaeota archaeon]